MHAIIRQHGLTVDRVTKRFTLIRGENGSLTVRDRQVAGMSFTVNTERFPTLSEMETMTEAQADASIAKLVYGEKP